MDIVLIWLVLAPLVGILAHSRGRSGFGFFLLSLLLSPLIGLIIVLVIRNPREEERKEQLRQEDHERQLESIKAIASPLQAPGAGLLTNEEFQIQKSALLHSPQPLPEPHSQQEVATPPPSDPQAAAQPNRENTMKQIILTAVFTAILTSVMTAGTIYFVASRMPDHQPQAQSQPAAEEQAPATPQIEPIAEQIEDHLAKPAEPSVAEAQDPAQTVKLPISREAFDKLVIGKTKDQVLSLVGKPDSSYADSNSNREQWVWEHATTDSVSSRSDERTSIIFVDGVVDHTLHGG